MKIPFRMFKTIFIIILIGSYIFSPTILYSQNLTPDQEYLSLIEKIKKGEDTDIDYIKLRMLYTQTSFYNPESPERDENILKMTQAWIDERYDEAIELGNKLLETEFLNPFVHDLFAKIYKETGKDGMLYHMLIFINIITSIQGDGKSYESAYQVISTWEEKGMMTFRRVTPVGQVFEPILHDGHYYHVIRVKSDETGEESDLYFNIDIAKQKSQQTTPVVTTQVTITPPPTPALQPITTYTDPSGQFSITFPTGFSLITSQTNFIQCATPNNGTLYLIISSYADTMKAFYDAIMNRPGSLVGESQFQAGNLSGKVQVYTMSGSFQVLDGKNYAVLLITYSGIEYGLVVVLPVEFYQIAQGWISSLITGVQYRATSTTTVPLSTVQPSPTQFISPSQVFKAPDGSFTVPLPSGSVKGGEWPNIYEYQTPNQGTLYILSGDTANTLNLFRQDLAQKQGKMVGQPVLFQTNEGIPGTMEVNTMVGSFQTADGKEYVSFLVSYERPVGALVIIVPTNLYTEAQGWISPLITGVVFQSDQTTPSPSLTPQPTSTATVTPPITATPLVVSPPPQTPPPVPTETLPPLIGG